MNNASLSLNRISLLIQRQLVINLKNLAVAFSACLGILLIINFITIFNIDQVHAGALISLSFVMIFIGGYIFTSIGFNELHSPDKAYQFLTLPATTLEKLISVWFLTSIAYLAVSAIMVGVLIVLCNLFAIFIGADTLSINALMHLPIAKIMWVYFVTHSIFLLGSCYFRKNNFLKTILALFVLGFIIAIYSGINGYIFFGPDFNNFSGDQMNGPMTDFMTAQFPSIIKSIFNYLLAPFFYVVSFFVLKERQV